MNVSSDDHANGSIESSPSHLDIRGAAIQESFVGGGSDHAKRPPAPSITLPNQDADFITHIALDIGGSLIKLVYFSPDETTSQSNGSTARGGRLHFVKFESSRIEDAIAFIEAKGLHKFKRISTQMSSDGTSSSSAHQEQRMMRIISTGGGAFKYADLFKSRLGVVLEREDEMLCLVNGCNFLLKAIRHEAFTYENQATSFVPTDSEADIFPYLLVNIGSGVSMVKVEGEGQFERISGSSLGGGTFWGLSRLLTGKKDFDEVLEMSMQGDNANVDMLVGDIYGGRDYSTIGLSASTIASSFGKVISQEKELEDYAPSDLSMALCRMISYNIGQLAYLNAMRYNVKRIFFGGFFIRGHPYTMDTIAYAIRFWSKGEMAAMFLRHEGFLGAVGAFLRVHPMASNNHHGATPAPSTRPNSAHPNEPATAAAATSSSSPSVQESNQGGKAAQTTTSIPPSALAQPGSRKVRSRFVERFSMGAPFSGGSVVGPAIDDLEAKVSWVEKFVVAGAPAVAAARTEHAAAAHLTGSPPAEGSAAHRACEDVVNEASGSPPISSHPSFGALPDESAVPLSPPLPLARPASLPWSSLSHGSGAFVRSAGGESAVRMALHVGVLHYTPSHEQFPLLTDPMSYEPNTFDINAPDTDSEHVNAAPSPAGGSGVEAKQSTFEWWLRVLEESLPTVMEKAIGSEGGTDSAIRRATAFGKALKAHLSKLKTEPGAYGRLGLAELFELREECLREFGFSDVYRLDKERENAASLSVLPDLLNELDAMEDPRARLLTLVEGCLASNIFDWGAKATISLYHDGTILDMYRTARQRMGKRPWAIDHFDMLASKLLPSGPNDGTTQAPPYKRVMMFVDNAGADVVLGMLPLARELLSMGCEVVMVANTLPAINDITASELRDLLKEASTFCPIIREAREAGEEVERSLGGRVPPYPGAKLRKIPSVGGNLMNHLASASSSRSNVLSASEADVGVDGAPAFKSRKLYVVANGQGSPCIDFRRVPDVLADACVGTDLVIIEGMGRAIHTNLRTSFRCDSLKLAMIKTEWLSKKLFGPGGALYDCVCAFDVGKEVC